MQTRGKIMRRGTRRTHVPVPHSPTASVLARDAGRRKAWDKVKSVENAVADIKKMSENAVTGYKKKCRIGVRRRVAPNPSKRAGKTVQNY